MTTAPTEEAPSLLNLVTIGAVATATIVVFFGVGFLLLSLPNPATQLADPAPASEALEAHEAPRPANNDTPPSASAALPANNVAAAETSGVQSDPGSSIGIDSDHHGEHNAREQNPRKEDHSKSPSPWTN